MSDGFWAKATSKGKIITELEIKCSYHEIYAKVEIKNAKSVSCHYVAIATAIKC